MSVIASLDTRRRLPRGKGRTWTSTEFRKLTISVADDARVPPRMSHACLGQETRSCTNHQS
jgi:hypothetical protein